MAYRQAPSPKPKLAPLVEAELMLTAARYGVPASEALNDAATRWIAWADKAFPLKAYQTDKAAYDAGRSHKSPDPRDYGLPPDYGIPAPKMG